MICRLLFALLVGAVCQAGELGSAQRGHDLLESQRCNGCHRFPERWNTSLPAAFEKLLKTQLTPGGLAAQMWNHAPTMWSALVRNGQRFPTLGESQASDLLAYFFAAGYFDSVGDARKGEQVFVKEGCHVCHLMESDQGGGPAVAKWGLGDPIHLLQGMWSHWPAMNAAMGRRRLVWPALSRNELSDILAFVRSRHAPERGTELGAGSSEAGRQLFAAKGCAACHQGESKVEFRVNIHSFTDLAASFWNHVPMMMRQPEPVSRQEMGDIVAYLWSVRYFEERGKAKRGKQVHQVKRCSECHQSPALRDGFSSASMIAALWKHTPAVMSQMREKAIPWPRFTDSEMEDLTAFLRTAP